MKICFLANINSVHTQRWIKYFAHKGNEIQVITIDKPESMFENITVHYIASEKKIFRFSSILNFFQIRKIINSVKPDIIHAHYLTKYGFIAAMTLFSPFVVSAWGSDIWLDSKGWKKHLTRFVLSRASIVHCDSDNMIPELQRLGADVSKIQRVYYGTDVEKFNPIQKKTNIRQEMGIEEGPVIISLRNLEKIYDVDSLIRAIPEVIKEFPSAMFLIIGDGSENKSLTELASSLEVTKNVFFLGRIQNDKLPFYITASDIYISTSLSDGGLAASTAEAMACGLPVIITDFGDNSMWVQDGINGYVVPLQDPKLIAERIIQLLNNPDICELFGKRNVDIIREKNNYYKEMERFEGIYNSLITKYPKK